MAHMATDIKSVKLFYDANESQVKHQIEDNMLCISSNNWILWLLYQKQFHPLYGLLVPLLHLSNSLSYEICSSFFRKKEEPNRNGYHGKVTQ